MKTVGIIAEYNPFHNGHQYHIEETRKRTGADYVIAVMSGDFVQRGAPAFLGKEYRTRMALLCGADLVIELPTAFACAGAEDFALYGTALLQATGVTDYLSFGCEEEDLSLLPEAQAEIEEISTRNENGNVTGFDWNAYTDLMKQKEAEKEAKELEQTVTQQESVTYSDQELSL